MARLELVLLVLNYPYYYASDHQRKHHDYRAGFHGPQFTLSVDRVNYRHAITNFHITSTYLREADALS